MLRPSHRASSRGPVPRAGVAEMLLHSVLVGVLGDFHFQALRTYAQEKTARHGCCVCGVAVRPAGGTCGRAASARRCPFAAFGSRFSHDRVYFCFL